MDIFDGTCPRQGRSAPQRGGGRTGPCEFADDIWGERNQHAARRESSACAAGPFGHLDGFLGNADLAGAGRLHRHELPDTEEEARAVRPFGTRRGHRERQDAMRGHGRRGGGHDLRVPSEGDQLCGSGYAVGVRADRDGPGAVMETVLWG